jgi:hypothetical protein
MGLVETEFGEPTEPDPGVFAAQPSLNKAVIDGRQRVEGRTCPALVGPLVVPPEAAVLPDPRDRVGGLTGPRTPGGCGLKRRRPPSPPTGCGCGRSDPERSGPFPLPRPTRFMTASNHC